MPQTLMLTGDVNLMDVTAPEVPFRLVAPILKNSDFVFSNLECCFYSPPGGRVVENAGFIADARSAAALNCAGIQAVGIANNVNYGEAAITSSLARLDELGIPHTGAGENRDAARAPVILERAGVRIGFLQRTSVYWPTGHEAGQKTTGVAVIRGHTAYQLPLHKTRVEIPPANRPGIPPIVITWADPGYLQAFKDDIAALRTKVDLVVASCHWGLWQDVLQYMTEIAHGAIDAGADVVIGHGPHFSLPIEVYKRKPIFYGLGSFSFQTGAHGGVAVTDWVGMLAKITLNRRAVAGARFQFVRHNKMNETVPCALQNEQAAFDDIAKRSSAFGTRLKQQADDVEIELKE